MKTERLVVVGNGMAATRLLEELLAQASGRYAITVIGDEPVGGYNRIMLSPVLAGEKSIAQIITHPAEWYEAQGVRFVCGVRVALIEREARQVLLNDGSAIEYDKLVVATGSNALILPFPGVNLKGVIAYRDLAQTEQLIAASGSKGRAVVIGGGLLGLEAANGLAARGMTVTVLQNMPWLLNRQLDEAAAALLQRELEGRGITFRIGANTQEILGDEAGRVRGVRVDDVELDCELVVMAVGIRPNTELANISGLKVERGVVVDAELRTSDPHVFALGECSQFGQLLFGMVAPIFDQARTLATVLAGGEATYTYQEPPTRLKVTGVELFSAGDFMGDAECRHLWLRDRKAGVYKHLVLRGDRLIGVVLYGDTEDGGWYFDLIRDGLAVAQHGKRLLFGERALSLREAA